MAQEYLKTGAGHHFSDAAVAPAETDPTLDNGFGTVGRFVQQLAPYVLRCRGEVGITDQIRDPELHEACLTGPEHFAGSA